MRFPSAVLLAALVIAPVCTECKKVSDERRGVDSTLSVDGFDCGGGGLRSGGNCPSGAHPGGKGATTTTTTARTNADVGAHHERWATGATDGASPGGDNDDDNGSRPDEDSARP